MEFTIFVKLFLVLGFSLGDFLFYIESLSSCVVFSRMCPLLLFFWLELSIIVNYLLSYLDRAWANFARKLLVIVLHAYKSHFLIGLHTARLLLEPEKSPPAGRQEECSFKAPHQVHQSVAQLPQDFK